MRARLLVITFIISALVAVLGGCAPSYSPSVPEDYAGPLANVKDSANVQSEQEVDFFYPAAVDGREIKNSPNETFSANYGRGLHMTPVILDHDVPARECKVTIVGRNQFAADILTLMNTVYEVKGEVVFRPQSERTYVVKGELREKYSAVWIEDQQTGEVVTEKVEVNGSAALGFFEK